MGDSAIKQFHSSCSCSLTSLLELCIYQYSQSLQYKRNSLLLGMGDAKELVKPQEFLLLSHPICPDILYKAA